MAGRHMPSSGFSPKNQRKTLLEEEST